jgi:hypothetical protein
MALTASFTTAANFSGITISGTTPIVDGVITMVNNEVAANNTLETLAIAFDKTKLKGVIVVSNIACNIAFGGTSNPSLQMKPGEAYMWHNNSQITNPFANNCTNMAISNNNSTTNAVVQALLVVDPT